VTERSITDIASRIARFALLRCAINVFMVSLLIIISGCSNKSRPEITQPAPGVAVPVSPASRTAPAPGALAAEVNSVAGDSETLMAIRKSGILRAAIDCSRPPLCFKDDYGIARGFEVDLLRQTAAAIGVKLNIVSKNEKAPIAGPFGIDPSKPAPDLAIYFFSARTGWLAMKINGDKGFREAVTLIWSHFYDTGTFQQLFLNRLAGRQPSGLQRK
jgi:ABC-type amino acid transport substrate-binding protein